MSEGVARTIERLLFPSNVIVLGALLLMIYLRDEPTLVNNALSFALPLLVYGIVAYLLRRRVADENKLYFTGALSALTAFFVCRSCLELSEEIVFSAISVLVAAFVIYAIRPRWKISAHAATLTGVCSALSLIDPIFVPLTSLLPPVIWSRLRLKAHTPLQIVAGTAVGLLVPLAVFICLRPGWAALPP
ncbi:TPA: hypothetical protein EYP44_03295 [Candidatus Bathyarchaeota archaeon]|nr:hypothetical protein [Candidatus Bathyarchaeota archaeon]